MAGGKRTKDNPNFCHEPFNFQQSQVTTVAISSGCQFVFSCAIPCSSHLPHCEFQPRHIALFLDCKSPVLRSINQLLQLVLMAISEKQSYFKLSIQNG